jgi:hypothetical protein
MRHRTVLRRLCERPLAVAARGRSAFRRRSGDVFAHVAAHLIDRLITATVLALVAWLAVVRR